MKRVLLGVIIILIGVICFLTQNNNKEFNYTISGKEGITDKEILEIKDKADKVYDYFYENKYEPRMADLIVGDYSKIKSEKSEIVLDKSMSDFEIMRSIMNYQFGDYVNYGLMYGIMNDIAREKGMEFEKIEPCTSSEVERKWRDMFISYLNFHPKVATKKEINVAKNVSVDLVKYIKKNKGKDFLFDLVQNTSDPSKVHMVGDVLEEWMERTNPDFKYTYEKYQPMEVFNINSDEDKIQYESENITWEIDLNTHEGNRRMYPDIYKNTYEFYRYMNTFYDEMDRLQDVLKFESSELPHLRVQLYPKLRDGIGGIQAHCSDLIQLKEVYTFSHEYIHFIDMSFRGRPLYRAIGEMRAEYYSRDFKFTRKYNDLFLRAMKAALAESKEKGEIPFNPVEVVESFIGRDMKVDDYYLLFNDLMIKMDLEMGSELPSLFDCTGSYPTDIWISIMGYIERLYGEDAIEYVTYKEILPDGSKMKIENMIEEWKEYIINLNDDDYKNYYYVD